jgi:hypothetical protein
MSVHQGEGGTDDDQKVEVFFKKTRLTLIIIIGRVELTTASTEHQHQEDSRMEQNSFQIFVMNVSPADDSEKDDDE